MQPNFPGIIATHHEPSYVNTCDAKPESTNVQTVSSPDFEKLAPLNPPFIKNKAQLENLQSVNGISIQELEKRARPYGYSYSGFIGQEESMIEVIKKDWETVEKLKVTHVELAAHLKNIIRLAEKAQKISPPKDFDEFCTIEYRTSDLEGNTIPSSGFQKIKVLLENTKGKQYDLFGPKEESQREVNTPKWWNEENMITSEDYKENREDIEKSKGIKLNLNSGVLSYIHHFGFYEGGGTKNVYRVDPVKVMALLTGKSVEELTHISS